MSSTDDKSINDIVDNICNQIKEHYFSIKTKVALKKSQEPSIYHMVHINNLKSILENGLFSNNIIYKLKNKEIKDISNKEVNQRREITEPIYKRSIHDYVPFYFNPRNAMLYSTQSKFSDNIIILEFNINKLFKYIFTNRSNSALFTNGNASKKGTYFTGNPLVLFNEKFINFSDVFKLSWWGDDYIKSTMMSEVLIHNNVPIDFISFIHTQTEEMAIQVVDLLKNQNRKGIGVWRGRGEGSCFFATQLII